MKAYDLLVSSKEVQLYLIQNLFPRIKNLKSFKSPFRKDTRPSCGIFIKGETYFFKDFGTNKVIPVVNLYKEVTGKNYLDIVIEYMFNSGGFPVVYKNGRYSSPYEHSIRINESEGTPIEIILTKWKKEHTSFWKRYRIEPYIVQRFSCVPFSIYSIGDAPAEVAPSPSFAYILNKEKKKLYMPESKDARFIANLKGDDVFVYGPDSDTVVVTSSTKDAICLYRSFLGKKDFKIIVPISETVKPYIIEKYTSNYVNRIVIYDNDETGIKNALKLKERGFHMIVPVYKDIADDRANGVPVENYFNRIYYGT